MKITYLSFILFFVIFFFAHLSLAETEQDRLKVNRKIQDLTALGMKSNLIGESKKAVIYYKQALDMAQEHGIKSRVAVQLSLIGSVYRGSGRYDKALDYEKKALAILNELGNQNEINNSKSSIGSIYHAMCNGGDKAKCNVAIQYYKDASDPYSLNSIGQIYFSMGVIYREKDKLNKAIEYFEKVLSDSPTYTHGLAVSNIAEAYFILENYQKAAEYYEKSLVQSEQQRRDDKRIPGPALVTRYMFLNTAYIRNNQPDMAFDTINRSSFRYFTDQLEKRGFISTGIKEYQKKISSQTALINYGSFQSPMGGLLDDKKIKPKSILVVADQKYINGYELAKYEFIESIKKIEPAVTSFLEKIKNLNSKSNIKPTYGKERRDDSLHPRDKDELRKLFQQTEFSMIDVSGNQLISELEFDAIIIFYRYLLKKPYLTEKEAQTRDSISKKLYHFLFDRIEKDILNKSELVIIPDGILAILPFETLIMPDDRYLIEKYHIKYVQSLSTLNAIKSREVQENQKPLIAFGGAIYEEISYKNNMAISNVQLAQLKKNSLLALQRGQDMRNTYSALGFSNFNNLPGSLAEVLSIKKIVPDADVFTGNMVSESLIKKLSRNGILKKYKVLHFATHGIVIDEIPGLSALVLSQSNKGEGNEDGYLNIKEISKLDIQAEFVNLSACDTGLGKIFRGEGVSGLAQAFLISGASGVSVSLWPVSDKLTVEFMTGLYKLVMKEGMSYDRAITEMKRIFIRRGKEKNKNIGSISSRHVKVVQETKVRDGTYATPMFWAPFIYYGK